MTPSAGREAVAVEVPTAQGTARARVLVPGPRDAAAGGAGTLLLGHGAGGRRDAADVLALVTLVEEGWTVVLVDQPWRVAGRRVATPPPTLDVAWREVLAELADDAWQRAHELPLPRPWVVGGRSAGARVACRTSVDAHPDGPGVAGVLCLAFPLHPPGRPDRSRAEELTLPLAAGLPTLVVQGRTDPFGTPEEVEAAVPGHADTLHLVPVPGAHSPSRDLPAVRAAAARFLAALR